MWHFMSDLVHSAKHLLGSSMYTEIFSSLITTSICLFTCWWTEDAPVSSCYEGRAVNVHRKSYCGCVCPVLWDRYLGEEEGHDLLSLGFAFWGAYERFTTFCVLSLCHVSFFRSPWSPPCGHSNSGPGFHMWASHSSPVSPPLLNTSHLCAASAFPVLWSSLLCLCQRQRLRQRQ